MIDTARSRDVTTDMTTVETTTAAKSVGMTIAASPNGSSMMIADPL